VKKALDETVTARLSSLGVDIEAHRFFNAAEGPHSVE